MTNYMERLAIQLNEDRIQELENAKPNYIFGAEEITRLIEAYRVESRYYVAYGCEQTFIVCRLCKHEVSTCKHWGCPPF
jgi:hypothetical protein